jgi:DNA-binding transcriptional regulator YhcF (GntR family)
MLNQAANAAWEVIRSSLSHRAATTLRETIRSGALSDPLPGTHELARRLGISRPSVSAALTLLAAEGLIVVRRGCRTRLAVSRQTRARPLQPSVCVIQPTSSDQFIQRQSTVQLELRARFASRGIGWEEVVDPKLVGPCPEAQIRRLVGGRRNVVWILIMAPESTQCAFARLGVPALTVGTCFAGVDLPSIDFDHAAVGWHAAGSIIAHGHTKLGLLLPTDPAPGDQACRLGFLRYINQQPARIAITEISAPANPARYRARLRQSLRPADRPTVLFTMRPPLTLTLFTHLLASGLLIPRDISIVSRDTHPLFDAALPELTRYNGSMTKLATRIVRITEDLLAGRHPAHRSAYVTPTFVPGSTLAKYR